MVRNIFTVNATQIVTSESHPEGLFSVVSGFPKTFDSVSYGGDIELTLQKAKSAYFDQLSKNYDNTNPNRVMTTVTLTNVYGVTELREFVGSFPAEPEPIEEEIEQ